MAITYIGDTSSAIGVTSPIPVHTEAAGTVPIVGLQAGDIMFRLFVRFAINGGASAVTGAGWTHLVNNGTVQLFSKVADSADAAAGGFAWIGAVEMGWAYRGCNQSNPIHATAASQTVTTTENNKKVISVSVANDNTVPSAMSGRTHRYWSRTAFSTDAGSSLGDVDQVSAGTPANYSITWAVATAYGSVALNPEPPIHDLILAASQDSSAAVVLNVEAGAQFIVAAASQDSAAAVALHSFRTRRRVPRRATIWVRGLDGDGIGVIA